MARATGIRFTTGEGDVFLIVANKKTGGSDGYHVTSAVYKKTGNIVQLAPAAENHRGESGARFHTQGEAISGGYEPIQRQHLQP